MSKDERIPIIDCTDICSLSKVAFYFLTDFFSQKLDTLLKNMRPCFCESGSALYLRI